MKVDAYFVMLACGQEYNIVVILCKVSCLVGKIQKWANNESYLFYFILI